MKIRDILPMAFASLTRNKSRTALTMLGLVIGIMSVILMLSIGQAAERFLLNQIASSFSSDMIFAQNGRGAESGGPPSPTQKKSLTDKDIDKLKSQSWLRVVEPFIVQSDLATFEGRSRRVSLNGVTDASLDIYPDRPETGRFIEASDNDGHARVIVLGRAVALDLFANNEPIGKTVKIGKRSYRVIGVMEKGGTRFFTNVDDQVYIPVNTAMDAYNRKNVDFIAMKTDLAINETKDRIREVLRDTHNIDNPENDLSKDDFRLGAQEDAAKNAGQIGLILKVLLGSIAAISLLVGGIGIMNIMYVTVTERTSEIGLRKAIGARPADVLKQFLAEAIVVTALGGIIGIVLGVSFSFIGITALSNYQQGWSFAFPTDAIILAFSVSTGIGIVFGFFPARRAAKLSPMEALRYE
ncbi:MAG: ABC transporter permease [Patescibacteria group bacterium]